MRKCGRNGALGLLCLFARMDGGLRRIRDKGGRVESKTVFKGERGKFEKGGVN